MDMKYFGSILDFTQQRNEDLMRAFRALIKDADYIVMSDIFQRLADSPASRFWVSEERASIVIAAMLAGRPLPRMRPCKLEMFEEIYRRFLIAREQKPNEAISSLVADIVNQPAPKFYLTPRTVGQFIYRIKNGWYERQFDRYKKTTLD